MNLSSKFLREFDIQFSSLKDGSHDFKFELTKSFFDAFDFTELIQANVDAFVTLDKRTTMLIFKFDFSGSLIAPCDRCFDPYEFNIEHSDQLIVKFSDTEDYDGEIVVIPEAEYKFNIAQYLYEFSRLAIPLKLAHDTNECNTEVLENLIGEADDFSDSDYELDDTDEQPNQDSSNQEIDPRWASLKNLKLD
jgi:uncharacterized metal-binding protein YceD (DUF177 family)